MEKNGLVESVNEVTNLNCSDAENVSGCHEPTLHTKKDGLSKNQISPMRIPVPSKKILSGYSPNSPRSFNAKANSFPKISLDHSLLSELKMVSLSNISDHSDGDTEEENNNHCLNGIDRLPNLRSKRTHPRFVSRSLPVTPRVNGNCPTIHNCLNGVTSSPSASGFGGTSTPLLVSPHLAAHLPFNGSFNSMGSLSPNTSQYITCTSGLMSESLDKVMSGSIDYSSLPLPKEDGFKVSSRRTNISRHMSEPCIHEIPSGPSMGKCHSCPQRKSSSKHRRSFCQPETNNFEESKFDDVEGIETQWQFIRTLIDELNKSRSQTNRMTVELHQAKMEIQMLKANLESYSEAGIQPGIISEMVGQIHAAQKVRDEAMMSRIKLANEERDAALIQTQSLLEKFGLSPRSAEQSHTNSNTFNDYQNYRSGHSAHQEEASNFDEELTNLRSAHNREDEMQEKYSFNFAYQGKGQDENHSQEMLEELKSKLNVSEYSRVHLQDRCAKLERVFGTLGRKMNGLSSVESPSCMNRKATSFTSQLSSEFATNDCASLSSSGTNASQSLRREVTSDPEVKDSSLDSEDSFTSSSHKNPSSFSVSSRDSKSTLTPPSYCDGSPGINSLRKSESENIQFKETHHQNNNSFSLSDYRSKNLHGVPTIMGPITEL